MNRDKHLAIANLDLALRRRDFLKAMGVTGAALALGAPALAAQEAAAASARKPNIILIVADDLGYGELGVQGCKDIPTPNIDSIAANGVRFTNGYVSCPVCSPTRAGLMTGRYQQRFGHEFNPGPAAAAGPEFGLPLSETTLAERLKPLGYATGMFGKWHLGYLPDKHPMKRGFDEFYGFLGGAHPYLTVSNKAQGDILRGTETVSDMEYTTDAFAREAVSFIERHKDNPFFVYLPFNAVHSPLESTEKYLSRFASIEDPKRKTFAAMQSAMDDGVGQVLAKVRDLGLEDNTLIFFISDNGGPTAQTTSANGPLRRFKAQVLEGGIRVPYMIQWKGHIPAGKVYDSPVISLDIHPTALAAAGSEAASYRPAADSQAPAEKPLDGVDLLPYLTASDGKTPHDRLLWRYGKQSAIRMGNWKMLTFQSDTPELYNLAEDIGEKNDLAAKSPEKLAELKTAYDTWNATLVAPRWKGAAPGARAKRAMRRFKRAT